MSALGKHHIVVILSNQHRRKRANEQQLTTVVYSMKSFFFLYWKEEQNRKKKRRNQLFDIAFDFALVFFSIYSEKQFHNKLYSLTCYFANKQLKLDTLLLSICCVIFLVWGKNKSTFYRAIELFNFLTKISTSSQPPLSCFLHELT